ncbi:MAG: erythromycin esterase family protein [Polyangiaceae bacterium]
MFPKLRDRAMAENLQWVLDEAEPGARAVFCAHTAHIQETKELVPNRDYYLTESLKQRYVSIGFVFGRGGFQAIDFTGQERGLMAFEVGEPTAGSIDEAMIRTGWPISFVDLRRAPKDGPVGAWFQEVHTMREIGSGFASDEACDSRSSSPNASTQRCSSPPPPAPVRCRRPRHDRNSASGALGPAGCGMPPGMSEDDRYDNRPILVFLENFALAAIGELPKAKQRTLRALVQEMWGGDDDWMETLRGELGWKPDIQETIRLNWAAYQKAAEDQGAQATPEDFAQAFADTVLERAD